MDNWKKYLLDVLLDYLIEMNGLQWMIEWLLESGYTEKQLIELRFDPNDIKKVKEEE